VSVVIPAYNSASTVGDSVQSALQQSVDDIEIIVVDDGSTDDTAGVVQQIPDNRVRLESRPNGGAAAARNTGIEAARGGYVALLDADDLWLPKKLELQLHVLQRRTEVRAVQSGAFFVDPNLRVISERRCVPSVDALLETLRFQNMPNNMSTLVIERRMFDSMGLFDTSLEILEEWDMAIKVARHCNLVSIEEPLSLYRVHPGNRSRNLQIHIQPGLTVLDRLFADPTLPPHIRASEREIYARFFAMLSGGALKVHSWRECLVWATKALRTDPTTVGYMTALPLRRAARRMSRLKNFRMKDAMLAR
jgi:glycosyltransferase involved in cell wall biosynthesis